MQTGDKTVHHSVQKAESHSQVLTWDHHWIKTALAFTHTGSF